MLRVNLRDSKDLLARRIRELSTMTRRTSGERQRGGGSYDALW